MDPISLMELSDLVWASQGALGTGERRTVPSAGALYPIETYVAARVVRDLDPGVYHYRPDHTLNQLLSGDRLTLMAEACLGQEWLGECAAAIIIAGVYDRTTAKYGQRGRRYVDLEAGHAAQNIYLQAAALGLGTVEVGAYEDLVLQKTLGLPPDHSPLAVMPVGWT